MEIKWSKSALVQLDEALNFIAEKGFISYAAELEENILQRVENLTDHYNLYTVDQYKKSNDGSYHAFEVDEYRVSYRVKDSAIRIIRIRHTSRKTKRY